jgi:phosphoribosyl 1,2-cyclic phosphate phosphodiesterase
VSATLRVTVLGCGSSPGVPRIGNDWGACDPNEPKNRRTRTSILIERVTDGGTTRVLVDTGPDLRQQLLAANVKSIDAVVYTHAHADHVHGIDDLRAFWLNTHRLVEVYADAPTAAHLRRAFDYCFASQPGSNYPPILKLNPISIGTPLTIIGAGGALIITPFRQVHGEIDSLGLRFAGCAYSCDISDLPAESMSMVEGVDLWIVDALRPKPHPSHFSLSETVTWIEKLKVKHGVLTHMHNDLDYQTTRRALPAGIEPAWDGMVLELPAA